jgi:phage recombination protein Bet
MSNIVLKQIGTLAAKLGMEADAATELMGVLKATAFKGQVSDAQLSALLVVANQYGLNPWVREIYAFPDKNNGIVPVVGVDGWARIINENPQFDGLEFVQDDESCTCIMYRKDRGHPIKVTEYMAECRRANTGPWGSHPKRMLRHKALIQCARLAFGFVGIYDEDEAERITERNMGNAEVVSSRPAEVINPAYTQEQMDKSRKAWQAMADSGKFNADSLINKMLNSYTLTEEQMAEIRAIKASPTAPADHSEFIDALNTEEQAA